MESMEYIKERSGENKGNVLPNIRAVQHQNNVLVNEDISSNLDSLEEGECSNAITIKKEILSPKGEKRSKKRKRESLHEDENNEDMSINPYHLPKKHKKEKKEVPKVEVPNDMMRIPAKEPFSGKKNRKDKKRASEIISNEVNAAILPEIIDHASEFSLQTPKKKIKKEKKDPHWSGEVLGVANVSMIGSPKKAKKKTKKDSEDVSKADQRDVLPEDIGMFGERHNWTLERVEEGKNKLKGQKCDSLLDISSQEVDVSMQQVAHGELRIRKERSKKKHSIDSVNLETASVEPSAVRLIATRELAEKESLNADNGVFNESVEHVKKKRKKDKKRDSEIVDAGLNVATLREEVNVIPDTPKQISKKKKVKEETEHSVKEERVADVSLVESSVSCEGGEQIPRKAKKNKKRDSEYGIGSGQGDVLSESMVAEEIPEQTMEKVKKIKGEINRELGNAVLNVSSESRCYAESRKLKNKHLMENTCTETIIVDHQDIIKGTDGMETFNEGVECVIEGDHAKKKKKKDKKRESELLKIGLDMETFKEDSYIIAGTPGQMPKKKKKKIKAEAECSVEEEGLVEVSSVPFGVSEETPRKAKKKKRASEYGIESRRGDALSEDIRMVEEMSGQVTEVVDQSKNEKWYIDRNPCIGGPYNNIMNPRDDKKMKKALDGTGMETHHEEENNGGNNSFKKDSKKWKRRHTMDNAGIAAASTDLSGVSLLPEVKLEGKMKHKKRQSLLAQGYEAQLLTPKKEKKIKKESIG
ncbi:cylicin-1-like isoform X2 [Hetaerina americana]